MVDIQCASAELRRRSRWSAVQNSAVGFSAVCRSEHDQKRRVNGEKRKEDWNTENAFFFDDRTIPCSEHAKHLPSKLIHPNCLFCCSASSNSNAASLDNILPGDYENVVKKNQRTMSLSSGEWNKRTQNLAKKRTHARERELNRTL